jgi:hypothetical protein
MTGWSSPVAPVRSSGRRRRPAARIVGACGLALTLATAAVVAQMPKGAQGVSDKQRKSLAKLAEPWPDDATMAKRKADSEKRPLFQSSEVLPFTLVADFKKATGDRSPTSTAVFPAKLTVAGEDGQPITIPVNIRNRGILRRNPRTCGFPPIRIEFPKALKDDAGKKTPTPGRDELKRSVFEGSENLKLVTHCSGDYEQYVLREYLAYRTQNIVTPWSLRTRLAKGTYIESSNGKTIATKFAFFIEEEDDLARRMDGRVAVLPRTAFSDHDMDLLTQMAIFNFFVGNTDYSIFVLHNSFLVQTKEKKLHAVTYDYDVTGLVDPPYALPAKAFNLGSVKERLYRGPCRPAAELEPFFAIYREKKDEIYKLYANQPELNKDSKESMKSYTDEFYDIIGDKGRVKRRFVDTCNKGVW